MPTSIALLLAIALPAQAPAPPAAGQRAPLAVAKAYLAAYGRFDLEALRGYWTDATVWDDPTSAEIGPALPPTRGRDAIVRMLREALEPLLAPTIEYTEWFHSGEHAVGIGRLRYSLSASRVPSARHDVHFDVRVVSVLRIAGETVVEHTDYTDLSGFRERIAAARRAGDGGPFQGGSLDEAIAASRAQQRPLFVLVTSPACLACLRMDATTWQDARLQNWLSANASTLRVVATVDDAACTRLAVRAFPTVIRLESGVETSRTTGARTAEEVLAWFTDPSKPTAPAATLAQQYDRAVDLMLGPGDRAAAARALVDVWTRLGSEVEAPPLLRWLRRERLPSLLAAAARDPAGHAEVAALLVGFPAHGPLPTAAADLVADWLVLQQALEATSNVDTWIDQQLDSAEGRTCLAQQPAAFARLVAHGRLADAGRIVGPSMWNYWVARLGTTATGDVVADAMPELAITKDRERAPTMLRTIVASLRAASRTQDADALAALVARSGK